MVAKGVGTVIRGQRARMRTSGSCLRRVCRVVANSAAIVVRNRSRRGDRNLSGKGAKGVAAAGLLARLGEVCVVGGVKCSERTVGGIGFVGGWMAQWRFSSVRSWWQWQWQPSGTTLPRYSKYSKDRDGALAVGRDSGWCSGPGTLRGFRRRKRQRETPCSEKLEAAGGAPLALSLFKVHRFPAIAQPALLTGKLPPPRTRFGHFFLRDRSYDTDAIMPDGTVENTRRFPLDSLALTRPSVEVQCR